MSWKKWIPLFLTGLFVLGAFGCRPQQPVYLTEKGQMAAHYIGDGMWPELPNVCTETLPEVTSADAPLTLDNGNPREYWDLALQDVVQIAMQNGKVLRNLGGVSFGATGAMGTPSALLGSPYSVGTVYDPALVESDPRYGVEAALSAFDGQLNASAGWTKTDEMANSVLTPFTDSDQGTFQATISKYAATGTTFYVRNNNIYDASTTQISRRWESAWSSYTEAGFTQALLQGRGVTFNRIAGPGAIPGYYNGVLIARIGTEKSLIDFEMGVRKMVYDTENAYWNLYYAYRNYDTVKAGLKASYSTWEKVYAFYLSGDRRGSAQAESQARQQFYGFYANTKEALNNIYKNESILRYAMGIAATDGRLIKPIDEPSVAKIRFEAHEVLSEGLTRAPEIRKMKWDVKQRELELIASRNFLLPSLNFTGSYRFSGMGHDLMNNSNNASSAYRSMSDGDYGGWHMGLELNAPFGWRKERAAVRAAELNLIKYRALLQDQELELSHNLQDGIRDMAKFYNLAEIYYNRRNAAMDEVKATEEAYEISNTTLDQLLDAQRRLAEAESSYFYAIINYNLSITKLHYLKGSLLEFNNVTLAEGAWPNKAQFDAVRQARKRDAGHYINYGYTRPNVISTGVHRQFQNQNQQPTLMQEQAGFQGTTQPQVIYSDQVNMYDSAPVYHQYETLPGNVNVPQPAAGAPAVQYQQPYRPVSYQTNNTTTNSNMVFATATPAAQQPMTYAVSYPSGPALTNPIAAERTNATNGYRTTPTTAYHP